MPYKVYAYQASPHMTASEFLFAAGLARGSRFLVVGSLGGLLGWMFRPISKHALGFLLVVYAMVFALGLSRVVADWTEPDCFGRDQSYLPCSTEDDGSTLDSGAGTSRVGG